MSVQGVLVTAAASRGWSPRHGELWLLDAGMLYRSLGWRETLAQVRAGRGQRLPAQTVQPSARPTRRFHDTEPHEIAWAHPANLWVPKDQLAAASLRRRVATARVELTLHDGTVARLTWPRREQATPAVDAQLRRWLGERLRRA